MKNATSDSSAKRPYHKPVLVEYGDIRTVTLGASTAPPQFTEDFGRASRRGEESRGGRRNSD